MKTALAIDVSGSMTNVLDLFGTSLDVQKIEFPLSMRGGTPSEPIIELARKYDKVIWITDGYFFGENLPDNVQDVLVGEET
jgi:predicted metal-dependent peptidase